MKHGFEEAESFVFVAEAESVGEVVVEHFAIGDDTPSPFSRSVVAGIVFDSLENLLEGETAVGELAEEKGGDFLVGLEGGDVLADEILLVKGELSSLGLGLRRL